MKKERNINLDLTRSVATIGVISVHFFLNTGFYQEIVVGRRMALMVSMRTLFMYCVPLFLLLTGFLMCNKKLEKKFYRGILHTVGIYIVASILCMFYSMIKNGETFYFSQWIRNILDFSGAPYAWYIEMYVGLFLMIPFLNLLYHSIVERKNKLGFIFTLIFLVTLPSCINIYGISILPDWWGGLWPLLYYFIGCYIRQYPPKINFKRGIFLLFGVWMINSVFCFLRSRNKTFEWGIYNDWSGFQNLIFSVLIFIVLQNLNLENIPCILKKTIRVISKLSLGIYLCSWIADDCVYAYFNEVVNEMAYKIVFFPVVILAVFGISMFLSSVCEISLKVGELFLNSLFISGRKTIEKFSNNYEK